MNHWTLTDKRALVTGAGRGIGAAIASEFLHLGAKVFGVARSESDLARLQSEHSNFGAQLHIISADLTDEIQCSQAVDRAAETMGGVDILINNAGIAFRAPALDSKAADLTRLMELNVQAAWHLCQLANPFLKQSDSASIINVSSVASQVALPNRILYGASKAALDHLTFALATEWGPDGIRVNGVLPWFTNTPITKKVLEEDPAWAAKVIESTPLGRVASPKDIARAVAFLAMPASSYVTGQLLAVDGGFLKKGI